ncbi:multifunctional acyl-CoA thioesterase I/protease I/lysophospholipase L1 [Vibrio sp. SCSIO 43136]|uniref:multifunctional acyl-CoA thioesterase I/protease I/lysophospholipase L1 n=1 Tax=Vibrio sp. SCSIO 43136 TaxID=2819101 RepID=UPI0020750A3A|nr:multifunctional acyl-CoA thioesterase I/protease I/lysophospholipase L1 [Vibrio sp. SCSIO 43136]USD66745.1 multifunctional acyl-CoA thioesterase I/protease I/lysophospholipase L1 [Vibrio sp. SCSIO 43136]
MIRFLSLILLLFSSLAPAKTLLVLGDSLSAGYNMAIEQSWPSLLSNTLSERNINIDVINGSISGDTTGNGLARLPNLLSQHQPDYVLIELGANDGLRGFPPKRIEANLNKLIYLSEAASAQPILMQIRVPPNYGKRYSEMFAQMYPKVAHANQVPLIPFFLEQVIIKPEWMMNDGLHPKPEAQPWIADFMAEQLVPVISD